MASLALPLLLWLAATPAPARIVVEAEGTQERVEVRWADAAAREQHFTAELPLGTLRDARTLRSDRAARAEETARRLRAWAKANGAKLDVTVKERVRVRGPRRQLPAALAALARLRQEVLREHGMEERCRPGVPPDEECRTLGFAIGAVALAAVEPLRPLADELGSLLEARARAERTLSLVQVIRYARGGEETLRTPLAVVRDGRGDCDEKVALFVALMRAHEPTLPLAVFHVEGHAFVGLGLDAGAGDTEVTAEGRSWVVAEPVGPALRPLGQLAEKSAKELREGRFMVRVVPGR